MKHSHGTTATAALAALTFVVAASVAATTAVAGPSPTPSGPTPSGPTPSVTKDPTGTPTATPTPTPTVTPTATPTPTPTPTSTTEPPPTPDPTPPPTPEPTAPPTTPPDEPDRQDPDDAYNDALAGAQTVAVAEAQRLLQEVLAEVDDAEGKLAAAGAAADAARAADLEAQKQLLIAQQSTARTQRQIADIQASTEQTRLMLGAVAREAYQGSGLATLGVVLSAETPDELTNRYMGMRTLLRAGDSALGELAGDEADLRDAQSRLSGQQKQRQQRADDAAAARQAQEATEQAAVQAQAVLTDKGDKYQFALSLAQQARLEDYRRYMELINESTALGEFLAAGDYGPGFGTGTFVRPGTGDTTSEYGPRLHPILGYVKIHTGLDFGRGDGNIYAADAGTVVEAKWNNAYGNMVVVDHGEFDGQRLTTMYAHQPGLMVNVGQRVDKGQVIGQVGSTGYSTGPHLHFEVRLDGQHTDPWPWVKDAPPPR